MAVTVSPGMPAWPQSVPLAAQNSSTRSFTVSKCAVSAGVVSLAITSACLREGQKTGRGDPELREPGGRDQYPLDIARDLEPAP